MNSKFIKNILGISILEGLVATAIVGIGFVAVLQMVTYSATSISTSGERTKANYIVAMVAEDIIGHKDTHYGISSTPSKTTIINEDGVEEEVDADIDTTDIPKFADKLSQESWESKSGSKGCTAKAHTEADFDDVYKDQKNDAYNNTDEKWNQIIKTDRYLKCKGQKDLKKVKLYNINYFSATYNHNLDNFNLDPSKFPKSGKALDYYFYDQAMYIGRIQINLNNGKKRKFLYFQADYEIKK